MDYIMSVKGPLDTSELKFCQSHEHLYIADGYSARIFDHQKIDDEALSTQELNMFRKAGGRTVVDAQPVGCGRDAHVLRRLSEKSDVHIIASTGFHKTLFYPEGHWLYKWNIDRLTRLYLDELLTGMYVACDVRPPEEQTDIRAGQIKTALDAGPFSMQYQKLFTAAANAAIESGLPMMVHIEPGSDPLLLADFLELRKMPADKTIFCHMDRSVQDIGIHKEICSRGIYLEFDTIARTKYHDDNREIEILTQMLDANYGGQILMSLDTTRARLRSYGNPSAPGLDYILTKFIPKLKTHGISEQVIERIFIGNPAHVFCIADNCN